MTKEDRPYGNPFAGAVEARAQYEYHLGRDCILPVLTRWGINVKGARVLDLGCGNGGLSVALAEHGAECWGIDVRPGRIANAAKMAANHGVVVHLVVGDILKLEHLDQAFDLVVMSEVVEHLENLANAEALLRWCRDHLTAKGCAYASFPPWFGPFAGHQAGWPGIRLIPWYHLLPDTLKRLLAPKHALRYLEFARQLDRLTLGSFERILKQAELCIARRELYHLRPEFRFRYGLPVIRSRLAATIPVVREVTTTGAFYLVTR